MERLTNGRWFGRFFAVSGHRLREMATLFSVQRVDHTEAGAVSATSAVMAPDFRADA
jgi:hypothetical protein